MNDLDKEHLLHKIVAVSGFLFALAILPVAQYMLKSSQEQGQVAGVSTEADITQQSANIPQEMTTDQCVARKQEQVDQLANQLQTYTGYHDKKIAEVQATFASGLTDPSAAGQEAVQQSIAAITADYTREFEAQKAAVYAKNTEVTASACGVDNL